MTREAWEAGAGFFLEAHGVEHFTALEVCPVGKAHKRSTLESAPPDFMLTALKLIDVLEWIRSGEMKLHIHAVMPLAEAAEAHRQLRGRETSGKVVLVP